MKPVNGLIFAVVFLTSCVGDNKDGNKLSANGNKTTSLNYTTKTIEHISTKNNSLWLTDLYNLVKKGKRVDTILNNNDYSVYYCKIGNFLNLNEKNALLVYDNAVELYTYKDNQPVTEDSIAVPDISAKLEFSVTYDDYNFDGQKDIYIQRTISNGWPMSRGCLITININTKKLERHDECNDLANMKPDPKNKIVISDSILDCNKPGKEEQIYKLMHRWAGDKLIPMKSNCHCK